jgi:hypothetical protein
VAQGGGGGIGEQLGLRGGEGQRFRAQHPAVAADEALQGHLAEIPRAVGPRGDHLAGRHRPGDRHGGALHPVDLRRAERGQAVERGDGAQQGGLEVGGDPRLVVRGERAGDLGGKDRHVDRRRRLAGEQEDGKGEGGEEEDDPRGGGGDPGAAAGPPEGEAQGPTAARPSPQPGGLELREDVAGGRPALPGLLDQAVGDDPLERGGRVRPRLAQRSRLLAEDRVDHPPLLAAERPPAGEHLVDHHPQRPEVGRRPRALAAQLLGGHVGGGADGDPLLGDGGGVHPAGEAEVEQLHPAVRQHHHVLRLEVAVHDAGRVRGGEGGGELAGDRGGVGDREAAVRRAGEELGEGGAVVVGHDEEARPLVLAGLVDGADVRMVEAGGGPRLAPEARRVGGACLAPLEEELDRHLPPQLDVRGEVDHPHAAAAERAQQPVVGDQPPGGLG